MRPRAQGAASTPRLFCFHFFGWAQTCTQNLTLHVPSPVHRTSGSYVNVTFPRAGLTRVCPARLTTKAHQTTKHTPRNKPPGHPFPDDRAPYPVRSSRGCSGRRQLSRQPRRHHWFRGGRRSLTARITSQPSPATRPEVSTARPQATTQPVEPCPPPGRSNDPVPGRATERQPPRTRGSSSLSGCQLKRRPRGSGNPQ